MAGLHDHFSWVVIVANAIVGVWAVGAHWVAPLRRTGLWWAAGLAHLTVAVQLAIGVALVAGQEREADDLHMFYGFLTLVGVAIIVSYRHLVAYRYLIYGFGGLFVMGLAIRAATLDPFPG